MEEIDTAPYCNVLSNLLECNRAKFEEYIGDNCLEDFDSQYGIVCITGNQSSGKSTILNYMFDGKFPTKAKNKGQTTLGADMGHDYENRILIFDFEGGDSKERGPEKERYEKTNSLLAFLIADVLIINIWHQNLTTDCASCFNLCKIVLTEALKSSNIEKMSKRLIFAIRDYDEDRDTQDGVREMIDERINEIFNEANLNKDENNARCEDIFEYECKFFVPYIRLYKEEFIKQARSFGNQIKAEDYWSNTKNNSLDIRAFPSHLEELVREIKSNDNINFTDLQRVTHRFKCVEARDQVFKEIKEFITKKKDEVKRESFDSFKTEIDQKRSELYKSKTSLVGNMQIVSDYENELKDKINSKILSICLEILKKDFRVKITAIINTCKLYPLAWIFYQEEIQRDIYPHIYDRIIYEFKNLPLDIIANIKKVDDAEKETIDFLELMKINLNDWCLNQKEKYEISKDWYDLSRDCISSTTSGAVGCATGLVVISALGGPITTPIVVGSIIASGVGIGIRLLADYYKRKWSNNATAIGFGFENNTLNAIVTLGAKVLEKGKWSKIVKHGAKVASGSVAGIGADIISSYSIDYCFDKYQQYSEKKKLSQAKMQRNNLVSEIQALIL